MMVEYKRSIIYAFLIPFILLLPTLKLTVSESILTKILLAMFLVIVVASANNKIKFQAFLPAMQLMIIFYLFGLLHYVEYYEIAHINIPISFMVMFVIGLLYPYQDDRLLIFLSYLVSLYLSYQYFSEFTIGIRYDRLFALGFDINYLGFLFNYLFLILVYSIKKDRHNLLLYLLLAVIFFAGMLTSSRGTILAFVFGFVLLLYGEKTKVKLMFLFFVVGLTAAYVANNYNFIIAVLERFTDPSQRDRLSLYAIQTFLSSGIFAQLFGRPAFEFQNQAGLLVHNDQLRILLEFGLMNLILYLFMYIMVIINIFRYIRRSYVSQENKTYAMFILMMILVYIFRGNFSNFFPATFIYYFIGSHYGMKYKS
jgi:hypothetical protein